MRRVAVGLGLVLASVGVGASVSADRPDRPDRPSSNTGWLPVESPPPTEEPLETECGTVTFVNDTYDLEYRVRTTKNREVYEERGTWLDDVYLDGVLVIDDLDNSGRFRATTDLNGDTTLLEFWGPVLLMGPPEDEDDLAELGLPNPFYVEHGRVAVVVITETEELVEIVHAPRDADSICELIAAA